VAGGPKRCLCEGMSCQTHFIRIHHKRLPTRTVAVLFVAAMFVHVYMGTIGVEGAFEAMGEGTVDVNWAKEHHRLWLDEEMARTGPNESQRQPALRPAE